jgi:hypothetical protein
MHLLRPVDRGAPRREVRGLSQEHLLVRRRHAVQRAALRRQVSLGLLVHRQVGEDLRVTDPPARVAVRFLDQLPHRARPVPDHACRHALRARHDAAVHHQHPVVAPRREVLDHHAAAVVLRVLERVAQRVHVVDAPRDPAPVARVERLHDHREPDVLRHLDRVLDRAHDVPARHGQADVAEHALRLVLVLRDLDGDGACPIGDRRLDAAQVPSQPELHQRAVVQPPHRDAPPARLLDDRSG